MVRSHLGPLIKQNGLVDGGVAQLGERLLCKQEVIGSIPFTSTKLGILKGIQFFENGRSVKGQDGKGIRRMTWHQRAKKDAAGCEKPREAASKL